MVFEKSDLAVRLTHATHLVECLDWVGEGTRRERGDDGVERVSLEREPLCVHLLEPDVPTELTRLLTGNFEHILANVHPDDFGRLGEVSEVHPGATGDVENTTVDVAELAPTCATTDPAFDPVDALNIVGLRVVVGVSDLCRRLSRSTFEFFYRVRHLCRVFTHSCCKVIDNPAHSLNPRTLDPHPRGLTDSLDCPLTGRTPVCAARIRPTPLVRETGRRDEVDRLSTVHRGPHSGRQSTRSVALGGAVAGPAVRGDLPDQLQPDPLRDRESQSRRWGLSLRRARRLRDLCPAVRAPAARATGTLSDSPSDPRTERPVETSK